MAQGIAARRPGWLTGLVLAASILGSSRPALAQSVLDCRFVSQTGGLVPANYAADVSGGFLRLLLVRKTDAAAAGTYVLDFEPFSAQRSIHARIDAGQDAKAEFWMATVGTGGSVVIDRWEILPDGASHTDLRLNCPAHG